MSSEIDLQPIKEYLLSNIFVQEDDIDENQKLFIGELFDSMSIMELLSFIEQEYNIKMQDFTFYDNRIETFGELLDFIKEMKINK